MFHRVWMAGVATFVYSRRSAGMGSIFAADLAGRYPARTAAHSSDAAALTIRGLL